MCKLCSFSVCMSAQHPGALLWLCRLYSPFLLFGKPLSIKCCAVPYTGEDTIVFQSSRSFSPPDNGKRPVFAPNQNVYSTNSQPPSGCKLALSYQLTCIPSCKKIPNSTVHHVFCTGRFLHEASSVGQLEKPGPLMHPVETGCEKDCGRREGEREGVPKHTVWLI